MKRLLALITAIMSILTACAPPRVDPIIEIETSETAFIVPLEGATEDQVTFDSIEYFEDRKVATKRITLPQRWRGTGRVNWVGQWIPTVRVIRVDRAPVTMQWRARTNGDTGPQPDGPGIHVESNDSIGFVVGVDLTAQIEEEDAATYLYNYGERELLDAVNENVRSFVVSVLSREFGNRDLAACKQDKGEISLLLFSEASAHFSTKGITITNLGLTDGLTFENPDIQSAIDATFLADQAKETAARELEAAATQAQVAVARARGEREAAEEWARARSAQEAMTELEIRRIDAEARKAWADAWQGTLPSTVMGSGNDLLVDIRNNQGE